jgi:hypothetical protein
MVASSTLIPPSVDAKPSSSSTTTTLLPRKDSNASSSGAFSEASRSFGQEENSTDSLYGLTSSTSSHYVVKCNINSATSPSTSTPSTATPTSPPTPPLPVTLTPRVKVTIQQPSITTRSSRFDSSTESVPTSSSAFLKTPTLNSLPTYAPSIMSTSLASSAPEFSISGTSSIDESEELALYEQYLSISYGRQSNPSPEMRKKTFDDWDKTQQRLMPRSKSEVNNAAPIDHSKQQQQQPTATSQIKTVSKFFFLYVTFLSDHCC